MCECISSDPLRLFISFSSSHHRPSDKHTMPSTCDEAISRTTNLSVPRPERSVQIVLGIINLFFFGIGTIIAGFMTNSIADVLIGIGQLLIPFVGWLWSVVWGVLMLMGR